MINGLAMEGLVGERHQVMARLSREIRTLETSGRPSGSCISSGSAAMDGCLPGGGYALGSMVEWSYGCGSGVEEGMPVRGQGALALALRVGVEAVSGGKYLVLVDPHQQFYAPGVRGLGVACERLVVLHPKTEADAIWGMDQALRSPAVGAVVAMVQRLEDRVARRLQLATEQGGGLGILVRDALAARRYPSWSEVQWRVRAAASPSPWQTRWLDLELMRAGGGRAGARLRIGLDASGGWVEFPESTGSQHESTGALHLAAQLAQPARRRRGMAS